MRITEMLSEFERIVAEHGWSMSKPPHLVSLVAVVLDWYDAQRVDDANLDAEGDMVLFQWGTYDFLGDGATFQVDITRQVMAQLDENEYEMWQLSSSLHFPVDPESTSMANGNRWCEHPREIAQLASYVEGLAVASFAARHEADRFVVEFGPV